MRSKIVPLILVTLFSILGELSVSAQDKESPSMAGAINGQFSVAFRTQRNPSNAFGSMSGMVEVYANGVYRVWVDKTGGIYFGYDLAIEPLNDGKQFRVSVNPLNREYAKRLEEDGRLKSLEERRSASLGNATLSRFPEPRIIDDGDSLALDVLINRQTGVKLVDVMTISSKGSSEDQIPPAGPARDFSVSDIQMAVRDHRLFINGELVAGDKNDSGSCSGEFIYFYLRGRGRFVFSMTPREESGFQKIGVIQSNRISFSIGGDAYEWVSTTPIVGRSGNWSLWVLYEPGYLPAFGDKNTRFFFGAMDGIRALRRED